MTNKESSEYDKSGVSSKGAETALSGLLKHVLPTRQFSERYPLAADIGYFANVVDLGNGQGIAFGTDGVGTKVIVAELLGRSQPIVRVMPQTLVRLQAGATAVAGGEHASAAQVQMVVDLFAQVGTTVEVSESLLDAVTGLSGSGPAYVYTVIEALADGGVKAGLPRETALQLAAQTVAGAGRMVLESQQHPAQLRDQVTSPGGTTIAGHAELEAGGVRHAFIRAVEAAAKRAQELGRESGS
mgnify:CR=1 FL=1